MSTLRRMEQEGSASEKAHAEAGPHKPQFLS